MAAEAGAALDPEDDGEGGGHHQEVVEMGVQKRPGPRGVGLEEPGEVRKQDEPVEGVSGQGELAKAVFEIAEPVHSASRTNPEAMASRVLNSMIITASF